MEIGGETGRTRRRQIALVLALFVVGAVTVSSIWILSGRSETPAERTVGISTESCGSIPGGIGTGVAIGEDLVVTVAHVALPGGSVEVALPDGQKREGVIVGLDTITDLALVRVEGLDLEPLSFVSLIDGESILVVGDFSGEVAGIAIRPVDITIEEVGAEVMVQRDGYEIRADLLKGDSGAGVFNADGELGGIVFAISRVNEDVTWVTDVAELERLIARGDQVYRCEA